MTLLARLIKKYNRFELIRYALSFLAVVIVAAVGYLGYKFYNHKQEAAAQEVFSYSASEYQKLFFNENKSVWPELEAIFKDGYQKHKNSVLTPFFLAYEADTLVKQDKLKEAIELMEKAIRELHKNSAFYYLAQTKLARMQLDSQEATVQEAGKKLLEQLSENREHNSFFDMALYYLGEHAWMQKDMQTAQAFWSKLEEAQPRSWWAQLARDKQNL